MLILFATSFFIFSASAQPCADVLSVDISNGTYRDGTIVNDGVSYPPKYTYARNVSGDIRAFGCPCQLKNCFRKCCAVGSIFALSNKTCEEDRESDLLLQNGANLSDYTYFSRTVDIRSSFFLLYGRPCVPMYIEREEWYIQKDGSLYIDSSTPIVRQPDQYCVDTFVNSNNESKIGALVCFAAQNEAPDHYLLSCCCMIVSCVFLLITVAVYAWLPELRNLHGKVLMAYLICLFFGFAFMATMQLLLVFDHIYVNTCFILSICIHFLLESAFFWLNVMCFDIWWTFSGKRGQSSKLSSQARFKAYSLYAIGIPACLTLLVIALQYSGLEGRYMPNLKQGGCFFKDESRLIYLYGPMVILCIANLVFFILTAMKIAQIKKQTSVLKSKESSTHDVHRNDKQRLILYIKLFCVMGINWILEVLSAIYPEFDDFWKITDSYNVLIGLIVFIIFVCKRKTLRLIKKRLKNKNQQSDSEEMPNLRSSVNLRQLQNHRQRVSQETIRTTIYDTDSIYNN